MWVVKEDKFIVEEGRVIMEYSVMIDMSSFRGGEGVVLMFKRFNLDEMIMICESKRDVSMMFFVVNYV